MPLYEYTMIFIPAKDKHQSFFGPLVNYGRKKSCNVCHRTTRREKEGRRTSTIIQMLNYSKGPTKEHSLKGKAQYD